MSKFVLVHGSWMGGWAWENVIPRLEADGHEVKAPTLPGHGDNVPATEITLDRYADAVLEVFGDDQVVLVGHSHGGTVIARCCERSPERVARAVYVCAYLPVDGQSLIDLASADPEGILPDVRPGAVDGTLAIVPDRIIPRLFGGAPQAAAEGAVARLVPEPASSPATPAVLSEERFGTVPRTYIVCTEDLAISEDLQRRMVAASPCDPVLDLTADHCPQFSAPEELSALLAAQA